jgi:FkbM family methyltransferase
VLSFEPNPPLQDIIRGGIAQNPLGNVTIAPAGLGRRDSTVDFYPGENCHSRVGRSYLVIVERYRDPIRLQMRHSDSFWTLQGWVRCRFLKIDVQGFEAFVLKGLQNRIQRDELIILRSF